MNEMPATTAPVADSGFHYSEKTPKRGRRETAGSASKLRESGRRRGRRSRLEDPAVREKLLNLLGTSCTVAAACAGAGTSDDALGRYLKRPENADFAESVSRARAGSEIRYVMAMAKAAAGGQLVHRETVTRKNGDVVTIERWSQPDVRAAMFMLERRNPEYRQKVGAELTGKDGGPVLVVNPIMPAGFSLEEPDTDGGDHV